MTPFHRPRLPRRARSGGARPEPDPTSTERPSEAAEHAGEQPRGTAPGNADRRSETAGSRPAPVRVNAVDKVAPLGPGDLPQDASASEAPARDSADVLTFPGRRGIGPERRRRPLRWVLGLLIALLALAAFAAVVFYSPLLAVRDITVQGTDRIEESQIREALDPLEGVPLTRIDDQRVRELVGDNIMVREVRAEAHPPHELVVNVTERVPVAAVKEGEQFVLVDNDGVAVGAVPSAEEAGVPLIDGGLEAVESDAFAELVRALQALPQPLLEQMQKAEAVSDSDLRLQMRDGSTVLWGTAADSEFKAEVLMSLTEALGDQGAGLTYDVSSPEYPVTRGGS